MGYISRYITLEDFEVLQATDRFYEGSVEGVGYAYIQMAGIPSPHLNNRSNTTGGYLPYEATFLRIVRVQQLDTSAEAIELSLRNKFPNGYIIYTVVLGDTLSSIAKKHGVTIAEIVEWNDIEDPNLIRVGNVFRLRRDKVAKIVTTTANATSSAASIALFMLRNSAIVNAYRNGQFMYKVSGASKISSVKFYGNQYLTPSTIAAGKASFLTNVKGLQMIGRAGNIAGVVGAGFSVYDVVSGRDRSISAWTDATVGTTGVVASGLSAIGYSNPHAAIFVALYGVGRMSYEAGVHYGPSVGESL